MNSLIRNTLCAAAFAGGVLVLGAGAASADTGTQHPQPNQHHRQLHGGKPRQYRTPGVNRSIGTDLSSTLHTNNGGESGRQGTHHG